MNADQADRYFRQHRDRHLADYFEFLRIPSISALPEHAADVRRAAAWVTRRCAQAGLEHARILAPAAIRSCTLTGCMLLEKRHCSCAGTSMCSRSRPGGRSAHVRRSGALNRAVRWLKHVGLGTDFFGGQTLGETVFRFKFSRYVPGAWAD